MTQTTTQKETEDDGLTAEQKLYRVEEMTNGDGSFEVEVIDWWEEGDNIIVEGQTAWGDRDREKMDFPKSDDPEKYKFVRIVNECGYPLSQAEAIRGMDDVDETTVRATESGRGWSFAPKKPDTSETNWESTKDTFRSVEKKLAIYLMFLTWPITSIVLRLHCPTLWEDKLGADNDPFAFTWVIGAFLSAIVWLLSYFVLAGLYVVITAIV